MTIRLVSRDKIEQDKLEKARKKLDELQLEIVDQTKYALTCLVDIDLLYDIRDFIDDQIENWVDEPIELDDDFLDDED